MNENSNTYSTRAATVDDMDFLWALHRRVYRTHIEAIWGWDEGWQHDHFLENFKTESGERLVVEQHGEPVGNLELEYRPGSVFVSNIQVVPEAQGQGLGTWLMKRLMTQARQSGDDVSLQAFVVNHRAVEFYERLGFLVTGRTDTHVKLRWLPDTAARL